MANENEKIMKDAQYRKGLSIAFFNANNAAVELVKLEMGLEPKMMVSEVKKVLKKDIKPGKVVKLASKMKPVSITSRIVFYRDWMLEEHKTYYANVIAQVGVNYNPETSIEKLRAAKTLEDLRIAWVLLSADERKNVEVRKVAAELKTKYTNEKA